MPVPNTSPPNIGLGRLLRQASTTFNRVFKAKLAPMGISYGQFQYLQGLWEADGLTQTELTRKVGVEMAASTAILDSLEKRKLIKRVRNSSDRRKIDVYLTAAGAGLKDQLVREPDLVVAEELEHLVAHPLCRDLAKDVEGLGDLLHRVDTADPGDDEQQDARDDEKEERA
jgi:DNA-binding MarR family transcriptional regulator